MEPIETEKIWPSVPPPPPVQPPRRRWPILTVGTTVAVALLLIGATVYLAPRSQPAKVRPAPVPLATSTVGATHTPLPSEVRGVYVTASTASSLERYKKLVDQVKAKGINAIVLDLKTESGALAFSPTAAGLKTDAPTHPLIRDLDATVTATHAAGMYLIARIPFFEDPDYAAKHPAVALHRADGRLWQDAKGLAWLDPAAESVWDYNARVAKEAYARGFDEIQFDYIRFATDGATSKIVFPVYNPKRENMRGTIGRLFDYLDEKLRGAGIPISVDVFGFTTWHQTDLGIGQWYADALAHFDYVSAMVYPSHYPAGTLGFKNPAAKPYEIVADSLKKGNEVVAELAGNVPAVRVGSQRPWLQAFNLGAVYTPEMITVQAKAAREAKGSGFLLWNAGNNYSSLPDFNK